MKIVTYHSITLIRVYAGWHHWLDGHGSEWTLGVGDGQGGLVCCNSWGRKELDTTEWLNWTDAPTTNAEEAEWFYEDVEDLLGLTRKKRHVFHQRGWECKSRKSRDTCSNRQVRPWSIKWSGIKANRVLPRECTGRSKQPLPATQETTLNMDIIRWSIPKLYWSYYLQSKWRSSIQSAKTRLGADLWLRSWTPYCKIQT